MDWTCCVPCCSKRSDRDKDVLFHCLPLLKKRLLKTWMQKIGRKNLLLTTSTRICSRYFVDSKHQKFRPDEYPTLNLLKLQTQVTQPRKRRSPKRREVLVPIVKTNSTLENDTSNSRSSGTSVSDCSLTTLTSTDVTSKDISKDIRFFFAAECEKLKKELEETRCKLRASEFRVDALMHH